MIIVMMIGYQQRLYVGDFVTEKHVPLFDLHSHTQASDGELSPEHLVERAVLMGVDALAITDHDGVLALKAAQQHIISEKLPLELINGVEISTLWNHHEIHIVGLGLLPEHPSLTALLAEQQLSRLTRAKMIAEKLEKARIPGAFEGAEQFARQGVITRSHFAHFLLQQGKATSIKQVFKHYLSRGKIGYVAPQWCTMLQAIEAIHLSGGCAVLAHPARYGLSAKWLKRLLTDFADQGGDSMEIAHCQQPAGERIQLASYAKHYQLAVSQGSDFHYPCAWVELGRNLWLPENTEPVWKRFPELFFPASPAGI